MDAPRTIIETTDWGTGNDETYRGRVDGLGLGRFAGIAGRGGMGVAARIEGFPGSADPVVVKLLRLELLNDPQAVARFRRELRVHRRLWTELQAPRLVPCLGVGETGGAAGLFGVFPFYPDGSLAQAGEWLPLEEVLRCLADAAEGLGALHGHRYIHRDVCPANIFVSKEGGVTRGRLGDLGVAIPLSGNTFVHDTVVERERRFDVGHPGYVDPWFGGTPLADLYGLGAALYRLLTGTSPPVIPTPNGLRLPEPESCRREVTGGLHSRVQELLGRLTARSREQRFASASEASAALQELATLAAASEASARNTDHLGRGLFIRWSFGGLAALLGTILLGSMVGGLGFGKKASGQNPPRTITLAPKVVQGTPAPTPTAVTGSTGRRDEAVSTARRSVVASGLPRNTSATSLGLSPSGSNKDRTVNMNTGEREKTRKNGNLEVVVAKSATSAPPDDVGALLREASRHVSRRHLGEAEVVLRRALAVAPGNPDAASLLALVLSRSPGGEIEALRVLRTALQEHPGETKLRVQLSRLLASSGDLDGAVAVLDGAPAGANGWAELARWRVTLERLRRRSG